MIFTETVDITSNGLGLKDAVGNASPSDYAPRELSSILRHARRTAQNETYHALAPGHRRRLGQRHPRVLRLPALGRRRHRGPPAALRVRPLWKWGAGWGTGVEARLALGGIVYANVLFVVAVAGCFAAFRAANRLPPEDSQTVIAN